MSAPELASAALDAAGALIGGAPGLPAAPSLPPMPELPLTRLREPSLWSWFMNYPPIKALFPIPILIALGAAIWRVFGQTWRDVDREAALERQAAGNAVDYRPVVCMGLTAVILTIQEYYGGRGFYDQVIHPALESAASGGATWLRMDRYDELYGYLWWVSARVVGYVIVPYTTWKILFPKDSLLDMGLRARGFLKHLPLYGLCLLVVAPALFLVAREPDFGTYYPFYKLSSRSWWDFLCWEAMYFVQFLALELFFRGWILAALRRTMGSAAIFAMAVPYCMIHYGKPYLEAHGAIVAGIVLGTLSMRTRSIYAGFLVHISVAFSMDFLALLRRDALPSVLFPP